MSTDIESISDAKARLLLQPQTLEEHESRLHAEKASEAFNDIVDLLQQYGRFPTPPQKNGLAALLGRSGPAAPRSGKPRQPGGELAPKYWLPHTQETWTGRGRTPRAFVAWQATSAYQEWKKTHPADKFPLFPG